MNLSVNGSIGSFLLAVLVYFLFGAVIDTLVTDAPANKLFKIILLVVCVLIALGGGLFFHA
jgi:CDP-diglyceride synthetase